MVRLLRVDFKGRQNVSEAIKVEIIFQMIRGRPYSSVLLSSQAQVLVAIVGICSESDWHQDMSHASENKYESPPPSLKTRRDEKGVKLNCTLFCKYAASTLLARHLASLLCVPTHSSCFQLLLHIRRWCYMWALTLCMLLSYVKRPSS